MFAQLMAPAQTMRALKAGFNNLTPGAPIAVAKHSPVLFTKFDRPSGEQKESLEDAKKKKKEKQLKNSKKAAKGGANGGAKGGGKNNAKGGGSDPNQDVFTKINLRVGVIEDLQLHASADKLYVETINIGEESGPRQIVSGLRLHYPDMASLKGRKVVVVANLKKANLVGVASNGMVSVGPVFVATTVVVLLSCCPVVLFMVYMESDGNIFIVWVLLFFFFLFLVF
jgi:methionine--tRNA ligase beta chain